MNQMSWSISFILFLLIKFNSIHCNDHLCNYIINKSDNNSNLCLSNECDLFIDPYSIIVKPNDCKTRLVFLSFSSFKTFQLFLNRIPWKLGDLFSSRRLNNKIRLLRIYFYQIDDDDQPIHLNQLNHLGNHIDFYQLFIQNLSKKNSLHELIHYYPNNPQWFIIKIEFICNPLMIYNQNPCSTRIISPSIFAPQRPSITNKLIPLLNHYSTKQLFKQENKRLIHLIILILIPLLIIIIISIYIIRKRCLNIDLPTSSIPTISNNIDNNNNGEYCEYSRNTKPYHISRLPLPHKDSLYKEPQQQDL